MSSILITNIKKLVSTEENPPKWKAGKDMSKLPSLENSFLYIINDKIAEYGTMSNIRAEFQQASKIIDASGKMVFPAFCDSHTHLLYPASREIEYVDKIKGLTYEEIAKRGGGILNTAQKMKQTTVAELVDSALERLDEIKKFGTGAVEIKSGYGLDTEEELKMLYAIRKLKEQSPLTIKATFLGAHSIPAEYRGKQEKYVDIVVNEMIPLVAGEGLADYVDVFCDKGFFTVEDTDRILAAGVNHGLIPKIHANELDYSGVFR